MKFYSTKHYGHNIGLSAVFRQPNADHSHCHFLHGYSLAFTFTFGCDHLDNKNWAVDFGGLKPLKKWLEDSFDHKTVVDINDPHMDEFKRLEENDLIWEIYRRVHKKYMFDLAEELEDFVEDWKWMKEDFDDDYEPSVEELSEDYSFVDSD